MTVGVGVNSDNDIYLDAMGDLAIVSDLTCAMQAAQQAVQAQRGEMIYHVNRGVPSKRTLWNGAPSLAQFRAAVRQEILLTTDVVSVRSLDAQLDGERAVYTAQITTVFGTGAISNGL